MERGVAKTRVRATPRVRVGVRVSKGGDEGEFKDRVKAYGNITVAMIAFLLQLSISNNVAAN